MKLLPADASRADLVIAINELLLGIATRDQALAEVLDILANKGVDLREGEQFGDRDARMAGSQEAWGRLTGKGPTRPSVCQRCKKRTVFAQVQIADEKICVACAVELLEEPA